MKYLPLIRALGTTILVVGIGISNDKSATAITFETPETPAPQRSSGGASRGNSNIRVRTATPPSVFALLPQSDRGTTQLARPTILLYLSQSIGEEATFRLYDEEENLHYQMRVPLSGHERIVAIQLPEDAPALEVDRAYQWLFEIQDSSNGSQASGSSVRGWIQRVEPENANGREDWYDTVAALARSRAAQPEDTHLNRLWEELLGSIGLEDFATAPIVEIR